MPAVDEENFISTSQREPDVAALSSALRDTLNDLGGWIDQQKENFDVRHNIWTGQTKDGRKQGSPNSPAFPWEGASDLKPFIVDEFCNNDVDLLTTSLYQANYSAVPVESGDLRRARMVSSFMRWMVQSQVKEIRRETEILANYFVEKGIGIMGVFWERQTNVKSVDIKLSDIAKHSPEFIQFIHDPELDEQTAEMFQMKIPDLSTADAKKVVKGLREDGLGKFPKKVQTVNRPRVKAYTVDEDFFFPVNTYDLQTAPFVFTSEYFTPQELRNKILNDGWDEKWVEEVIEKTIGSDFSVTTSIQDRRTIGRDNTFGFDKTTNLVRIATAWEWATDDEGVPGVWLTVFHPDLDGFGKFELFNYDPVRFPFVAFARERRTRRLLDTRGVPEIGKPFQDEIKVQRDSRVDRTAMATCPPRRYPVGRAPKNWGPGTLLATRRDNEYGFVEIPKFDQGSIEIEGVIRDSMDEYFGRNNPNNDPVAAQTKRQAMVNRFLESYAQVLNQMFSLHTQFGPEEEFFRVVGEVPEEEQMDRYIKSNNAEKYDFYLDFNVLNQDSEVMLKRIETIGQMILSYDQTGQTDMGKFLQKAISAIDPTLGDAITIPQQSAQMKEIEKTQEDMTKIFAGFDVDPPENANVELRQQVAQSWLQGSEEVPATDIQERLQSDELFAGRIENYMKKLNFQSQQRQNAEIGRRGGKPGNAVPS